MYTRSDYTLYNIIYLVLYQPNVSNGFYYIFKHVGESYARGVVILFVGFAQR